jgi:hypothetical protein
MRGEMWLSVSTFQLRWWAIRNTAATSYRSRCSSAPTLRSSATSPIRYIGIRSFMILLRSLGWQIICCDERLVPDPAGSRVARNPVDAQIG